MQIVFRDPAGAHELDVVVHDPDATVADLVAALGGRPTDGLGCDGGVVGPGRRLDRAGIRSGSEVELAPAAGAGPMPAGAGGDGVGGDGGASSARPSGAVEVAVVGGLAAGGRASIGPGRWPVGRDGPVPGLDHDTVSARHARLDVATDGRVAVTDLGSLNGTWVRGRPVTRPTPLGPDEVVRVGALQLAVRPPVDGDRPAGQPGSGRGGATVAFNRPPRAAAPPPPEAIDTPLAPRAAAGTSAIGVMSILAPLAVGGALVVATGQPSFGLVAVLSPIVAVGGAVDSRRRGRKGARRDAARFQRELADLAATLARLAADERARRVDEVPDPAELLRRIEAPSTRLWERRPGHHDWLHLRAGIGTDAWSPPIHGDRRSQPEEVRDRIDRASRLTDAPVLVDLDGGGVVGVVGPRPAALAVARSLLVQATVLHGPADLPTVVLTAADRADDWDWAKWLPHLLDPAGSGRRLVATDPVAAEGLCRSMLEAHETRQAEAGHRMPRRDGVGPATLVVIDGETLTEGRRSPARSVLRGGAGRVAGIVVAATEDRLPAAVTTVVEVADGDGTATVHHVRDGIVLDRVLACGSSEESARRAGRGLARFDDPELEVAGAGLPAMVGLLPLLGLDDPTPEAVAARWAAAGDDPDLVAPVGVSEDGVLTVDLVRDGPHGLVAGTTGAGKSELLRSLVAGLAASSSPDHCTFLLVDFKGGSAFDRCAGLPHTVGMVTDLDAHLAERALRCLEAELRHRERVLRAAGAPDLPAYRRRLEPSLPPLPRLVVVVDEFATLKAELPDFVESLVGVAQRGRSLGVHLVLATQRPSGAVSESIRANTNLRIALRVQDPGDSDDVIGVPDAARIGRAQPGRALARFGPGEVVPVQTALSTGVTRGGRGAVEVRAFRLVPDGGDHGVERTGGRHDLDLLVDACRAAHAAPGRPAPRRPWPDPLPAEIDLARLRDLSGVARPFGAVGAEVTFTLADAPDDQTQVPSGWVPADGNLVLAGLPGTGTTTALAAIVVAAARTTPPDDLHVYALDMGTAELDVLGGLPHVGAVVHANDHERQARLVAFLRGEVERRRGLRSPRTTEPRLLVVVDGIGAFRAEWEEVVGPVLGDFSRAFVDGPDLGIHVAVSGSRCADLPAPLRALVRQQLLFRLGDDLDHGQAGFRPADLPTFVPGRAVDAERHLEVQVARPAQGMAAEVAEVAARHPAPVRRPTPVASLPHDVPVAEVAPVADLDGRPRHLPLGIAETTLAPTGLVLFDGEHGLVAGPARSGRSTALAVAGSIARGTRWRTVVVAGRRSPLGSDGSLGPVLSPDDLDDDLLARLEGQAPTLLLVDDAEAVDPDGRVLPGVLDRPDVVVLAAGRADALRGLYSHWTRTLRASRAGLLLQPDVDLDGDLLAVRLPRRTTTALGPGRGYLCADGEVELVQVAQPSPTVGRSRDTM